MSEHIGFPSEELQSGVGGGDDSDRAAEFHDGGRDDDWECQGECVGEEGASGEE